MLPRSARWPLLALRSVVRACLFALAGSVACCAQSPLPDSFNPEMRFDWIYTVVYQPDGKILVGGLVYTDNLAAHALIRLHPDGTLDSGFAPAVEGEWAASVTGLAVDPEGRILVSGYFSKVGGQRQTNVVRLNANGGLDPSFNLHLDTMNGGAAIVPQPDGKLLLGGGFTNLSGQARSYLCRVDSSGRLEIGFHPEPDGWVSALALQPDGKILVAGSFLHICGQPRNGIARLNPDGTLDTSFNAVASDPVSSFALQADGKIIVAGTFTNLCGGPRSAIGRLNPDGTLDEGFHPLVEGYRPLYVQSVALQADGKLVIGGSFTVLNGQPRNWLGRLNPDGSLDAGFDPCLEIPPQAWGPFVGSLALQPDGKVLVAGFFASVGGQPRNSIARLNPTDPATQELSRNGPIVTWLRGGTSPELWRTTFELSTNGLDWSSLGPGARTPGGWTFTGITTQAHSTIRARGFLTGGLCNYSSMFVETGVGGPAFSSEPINQTNGAGNTATLIAAALGSNPLTFQWLRNGAPLSDSSHIAGAHTPILTVNNLLKADEAGYSVVVTNFLGSITSGIARLTVLDPWILTSPASQERDTGQSVTFQVTAAGTIPIGYQWRKEGVSLVGATHESLTLTNVRRTDAGNYTVVVSNCFGSLTSTVAVLTINSGLVDSGFNPGAGDAVFALAHQADGKILVGGAFTSLGGATRNRIGRLHPDGTLDMTFNPWASDTVYALAVQTDGCILAAGEFTMIGGLPRDRLARLFPAGTADESFSTGTDDSIFALALQSDGKILLAGRFTSVGGQWRNHIARLNPDGTLDDFNPNANDVVGLLAVQPDGKILVSGEFSLVGGQPRQRLARLNPDGTVDSSFSPAVDDSVFALALQRDGRIVIGGWFNSVNGQPRSRIARLNADGTLDEGFDPGADGDVSSLAVQTDGRILAGGFFTTMGGQPRCYLARLNADGTLDDSFDPVADYTVFALAMQADGKTVVGGLFNTVGGRWRPCIARLNNTEPATQSLGIGGSTITWMRGGAGPEIWRSTFEISPDGSHWTSLGAGSRVPSGWELTGASLPAVGTVRARGFLSGGQYNGSTWFVEQRLDMALPEPPRILTDDGALGFTDRQFGFNVQALPNQVVVVEGSSDLLHWSALGTNTHGTAPILFRDPASANLPLRFYRARLER